MFDVTHIITTIERGGAENQLLILAREQVRRGLRIAVIPLKGRLELQSDFMKLGVTVFSEIASYGLGRQMIACRKIASDSHIVHCHLPRAELIGAIISKSSKLVVSRHNTESFFPDAPSFLSRSLSRFVLSRSKSSIAISTAVADYLVTSGELPRGIKPEVVLYGLDSDFAKKFNTEKDIDADILARLRGANFVVTTIGRLAAQKDYPTLFSAFQLVLATEPNSVLVVIGEGDLLLELKELSHNLGISGQIIWIGKTHNVASYLSLSDIFVLTSKYEGFGLVLLEAMLLNVPIVASRNSAIREVLTPEHAGLVETGDYENFAEKFLIFRNERNRSQLLEFQAARLTNFSPSKMEAAIFQIYSS
ncbi:RfaG Glycosyltransferase [Candidatus Nanopelagicaceae bacterium]